MTRIDIFTEGVPTEKGYVFDKGSLRMHSFGIPVTMDGPNGREIIGEAYDLERTPGGVVSIDIRLRPSIASHFPDLANTPVSVSTAPVERMGRTILSTVLREVVLPRFSPPPVLRATPVLKPKGEKETAMSLKKLQKAVKKQKRDDFPDGTVVRWTASDRYTYAAIKTPAGWYTTARAGNPFVRQVIEFEDLLEIVARGETTNVMVATDDGWVVVG